MGRVLRCNVGVLVRYAKQAIYSSQGRTAARFMLNG